MRLGSGAFRRFLVLLRELFITSSQVDVHWTEFRKEPSSGDNHPRRRGRAQDGGLRVTSVEEFYWLDGGYSLVQIYETVFGDEPAQGKPLQRSGR